VRLAVVMSPLYIVYHVVIIIYLFVYGATRLEPQFHVVWNFSFTRLAWSQPTLRILIVPLLELNGIKAFCLSAWSLTSITIRRRQKSCVKMLIFLDIFMGFTAQCTLMQSAFLRSHVVRPSVCLSVSSVCDVGGLWSHIQSWYCQFGWLVGWW